VNRIGLTFNLAHLVVMLHASCYATLNPRSLVHWNGFKDSHAYLFKALFILVHACKAYFIIFDWFWE
jgi:hypothetical protein